MKNSQIQKLPKSKEHNITQGDIFLLWDHVLHCSDSRNPDMFRRLLRDGQKINLLLTDPPYWIDYVESKKWFTGTTEKFEDIPQDGIQSDREYAEFKEIGSNPCFHILQRKMLPTSSMQTRWYLLFESECCKQVWGLLSFSYGSKTQLLSVVSIIFLNTNSLPTDGMESMLSMVEKRRVFCLLQESGKTQYIQRWSLSHSSENLSSIPVNEEIQSTIHSDEVEVRLWRANRQVENASRSKSILFTANQ